MVSMCTRYLPPDQAAIEAYWGVKPSDPLRWPIHEFPRAHGPFLRSASAGTSLELAAGQFGLIPWFTKVLPLKFATQNARFEGIEGNASFKHPWQRSQRCIIPALAFAEPCWETGKNLWWQFRRADGAPWGLAGLWTTWANPDTGEHVHSFTMLTINADDHPIMRRMHKPDPTLGPDEQDKRSVVAIEPEDLELWLHGSLAEASTLIAPPDAELMLAGPLRGTER
jgi:putative SOS response-associated peptidase YedK